MPAVLHSVTLTGRSSPTTTDKTGPVPVFHGDVKVSTGRGTREQRVVDGGHTINASKKIANNNKLAVAA